nr:hypothetical protein [Tanacetum cinerariifolium]
MLSKKQLLTTLLIGMEGSKRRTMAVLRREAWPSCYETDQGVGSRRKISRKGRSIKCSQCGNSGHNKKGCRGKGGTSQAGGSSQQSRGARQASGARNISSQALGSSKESQSQIQAPGVRNALSQVVGSSQPSAAPSQAS